MTDLTIFDAEVVPVISMEDAVALDKEIRNRVTSVNDEMLGLQELIDEAKRFDLHTPLGFPSWTAYVADVFTISNELGREQRRELVGYLAGEGMSNRAIAQAVGVDARTVRRDREQVGHDAPPDRPTITVDNTVIDSATGEVISEAPTTPPVVTGLDGKTYTPPAPRPAPKPVWSEEELALRKQLENGETVVVSMRGGLHANVIAWAETQGLYVRIDRNTIWGNPFVIGDDGDRDDVIAKYADHYLPQKNKLQEMVGSLVGSALGCWCAPDPCHGDVLKMVAEGEL